MKKVVLITGASGMLAKRLAIELENNYSIRFLTRKVKNDNDYFWDIERKYINPKALISVDHIIHLAGSSIASKRWTKKRKRTIHSSRIDSSKLILSELKRQNLTIESFLSASAIGYYGTVSTSDILNEESPRGSDFLSNVCNDWERSAKSFKSNNIARKVAILRIGVIFSKDGGALKKIVRPINFGFGSAIGTGNQWMPWIHIEDLCRMFKFIIETKHIDGTFNAVSPEHTTNKEFTRKAAKVLVRKIILPNIPAFILKLLFGEMSVLLLKGNRISSKKIQENGFEFKFKELEATLKNVLD